MVGRKTSNNLYFLLVVPLVVACLNIILKHEFENDVEITKSKNGFAERHNSQPALPRKNTKILQPTTNNDEVQSLFPASHQPSTLSSSPFTYSIKANVARGMNILHLRSGCAMAVWYYRGPNPMDRPSLFDDCAAAAAAANTSPLSFRKKQLVSPQDDAPKIQSNDTVYVPFILTPEFAQDFLPHIANAFVLITRQFQAAKRVFNDSQKYQTALRIVNSDKVLLYFLGDAPIYASGMESHDKIRPFPMGLKPTRHEDFQASFMNPVPHYREAFLKHLHTKKTIHIHATFLRESSETRRYVPRGPERNYPDYLSDLAKSWYVLSPNGDRPECHRHYEAIGLGTIPITGLDPRYYGHLKDAPVIFNTTDWDLNHLKAMFPIPVAVTTNRNMVFEEFWMAYVDQTVGRSLQWWDVLAQESRLLKDFKLGNANLVMHKILGRTVDLG